MLEFIATYWMEFVFGLMVSALGVGYRFLYKKIKQQDAVKDGMRALLRAQIIEDYHHYMEKGYLPIYAHENVSGLFTPYTDLGGNGAIQKLIDSLYDLPTEPPESIDTSEAQGGI